MSLHSRLRSASVALALFISACSGVGRPSVTPQTPQITGVSPSGLELGVDLKVDNPNPFPLIANEVKGTLYLAGDKRVGTGSANLDEAIDAKASGNVASCRTSPGAAPAPCASSSARRPYRTRSKASSASAAGPSTSASASPSSSAASSTGTRSPPWVAACSRRCCGKKREDAPRKRAQARGALASGAASSPAFVALGPMPERDRRPVVASRRQRSDAWTRDADGQRSTCACVQAGSSIGTK